MLIFPEPRARPQTLTGVRAWGAVPGTRGEGAPECAETLGPTTVPAGAQSASGIRFLLLRTRFNQLAVTPSALRKSSIAILLQSWARSTLSHVVKVSGGGWSNGHSARVCAPRENTGRPVYQ